MEKSARKACRVLIVDDDDMLRETVSVMLQTLGYESLTAANGNQALELYRQYRSCVVLLDVSMSGMDGHACLHELRRIDPAVRVILSSGYLIEDEAIQGIQQHDQICFLQKPYGPQELKAVLKQAVSVC